MMWLNAVLSSLVVVLGILVIRWSGFLALVMEKVQAQSVERYNDRLNYFKNKPRLIRVLWRFFTPEWRKTIGLRDNKAYVVGFGALVVIFGLSTLLLSLGLVR